ncbi:MAG: flagellar type III secretion system pore protein FliP [Aquificaceae bacterium]|nr:flagellar type III secretion system pore protein FliP [Aquificaceae bacterium]MCS7196310.1 flagellar type III secretion system pore protein FliP [Aquificaceae bacterium]MCX7989293.1 flagellar type III secretion system pore protein FliP [Aquificaceae bacterium]MDW8032049.1 flagellar type III secretion system pore protein FliP [Aquificaceae bacterium]MDW8294880.1 flagellar type III secretion system pore protein FliP [Aquificaceae bacterium]
MKLVVLSLLFLSPALSQQIIPNIDLRVGTGQLDTSIRLLILLTVLSLAPSILIMTTSFIRIVIVLSLLRQALGVPTVPPNQVIVSLALFLTFFIMKPVFDAINQQALQPLFKNQITDQVFFERTSSLMKEFMVKNTRKESLKVFLDLANLPKEEKERIQKPQDIPLSVVIPAFMVSEIATAFQIVFLLYLPFLIIDLVVASILISMGILMIPPQIISLPFKVMLFVLANGWELVVLSLVRSYQ